MIKPKIGQIAFWDYRPGSGFGHILFGTICEVSKETNKSKGDYWIVLLKEYGAGYWFRPFLVLPEKNAQVLIARIKQIEAFAELKEKENRTNYFEKLAEIIPEHPLFVAK